MARVTVLLKDLQKSTFPRAEYEYASRCYENTASYSVFTAASVSRPVLGLVAQESKALELVGYLPYYRMNASYNTGTLPTQLGMLNEIRYFGLTAANDGSIVPLGGSGTMQSHLNNIALIKQKIEAMPVGQRPRLDITLGGAGEDATFTNIARTVSGVPCNLCTTFAQNIKSLLDSTGAAAVDIDWEHPDAGVERSTSYPDMLKRIKHEVGACSSRLCGCRSDGDYFQWRSQRHRRDRWHFIDDLRSRLVGKRSGQSISRRTLAASIRDRLRRCLDRAGGFAQRSDLCVRHLGKQCSGRRSSASACRSMLTQ